jgi:GAF domain-containing protein
MERPFALPRCTVHHPNVPVARVARTNEVIHVADATLEQSFVERDPRMVELVDLAGARSLLTVPMIKDSRLIGAINIYRQEVRPFSDKQIELLKSFAAQAVIAIENTRLLNELRQRTTDLTESLEQQTATSEVLRVISSSPGDLQPVFDALLANATRLCEASYGAMWLGEGDGLRAVSLFGALPKAYLEQLQRATVSPLNSNIPMAGAIRNRRPVQVADLRHEPAYLAGDPLPVAAVEIAGIRTLVAVPMFKDDQPIGNIAISPTSRSRY